MKPIALAIIVLAAAVTAATSATAKKKQKPDAKARQQVEVCFVLDTTGSMSGLIAGAKAKIWSIANDLTNAEPSPQLKIGLVGYRDRGDDYITRKFPLTDDLDAVYENLMKFQAGGGGDSPESVNQGLSEAVNDIKWSAGQDALKIIFLVGDCPPHMDYQDDVKYPETCKSAVKNGIIINSIQCGNNTETRAIWKEIAHLAEGSFAAIVQEGGMAAIETPVDSRIAELTREINGTVIAFGNDKEQAVAKSKISLSISDSPAATAARQAFFSKNLEGRVISGHEDLISEVAAGNVDLDEVETKNLPEKYRKLSKSELTEAVKEQQAKRDELQAEMSKLVTERNDWVKKTMEKRKAGKKDNGFDAQIRRAVKEQGAKKGIKYKS